MRKVIKLILSLIIIICIGIIIYKSYLYYIDKKEYLDLEKYKPEVSSSNDEEKVTLADINNDYKFWLSIDNTKVNYPVVQGDDNKFYLEHNFSKEYSISGTLFVDYRNDINKDKNIIIYGHNMRNGTMFNELKKFKDEEFFYNNYITIIKDNNEYKYEVFSVYALPENEITLKKDFVDENEYLQYLNNLIEKSYYNKNIELNYDSNIITLITCSYEYNNARTIVHAKLSNKIQKKKLDT